MNRIIAAGYEVDIKDERMSEIEVKFIGPPDSPYKGVSHPKKTRVCLYHIMLLIDLWFLFFTY